MTSTELYRRAETLKGEADYWHKVCTAIKWAFVLALITCLCAIFYLFGMGKQLSDREPLLHAEMVQQWYKCRQAPACESGPFRFTRVNPYLYSVEIAGAESTNINRVGGR